MIEQILNHQSGHRSGIAAVYNRSSYEREVRAALALWADHLRSLITGAERKIVNFRPPLLELTAAADARFRSPRPWSSQSVQQSESDAVRSADTLAGW